MEKKEYLYNLTLKSLFSCTGDMIFIKDKDLKYMGMSDSFAKMANIKDVSDYYGKTDFEIFNKELAEKYTNDDKKLLSLGKNILSYVEPLPEIDGKKKLCSTSKYILRDENGEIVGMYGLSRDITAEIELLEQRENRELSSRLFEAILEADISQNKMIQAEGSAWIQNLELTENSEFTSIVSKFVETFVDPSYADEFKVLYDREKLLTDFARGKTSFNHICSHSVSGQNPHFIELKSRMHFSRITNTIKMTTFIKDIDEEFKNNEELKLKALTDSLTGLYNRDGFEQKIKERLEKEKGYHALIFMDLDCFKHLNDTYGHMYGDKVIKDIADKLKGANNGKHVVGRFGGDEFVVFTEGYSNAEMLEAEVEHILHTAQYYKFENNMEISVTCTIGATIYQNDKTLKQLYEEADTAMYCAKQSGKNCYAFYSSSGSYKPV